MSWTFVPKALRATSLDPLAEAMAGLRAELKGVFSDLSSLAQASLPDLVAKAALGALEDLFSGRATAAAQDAALLIARGTVTYADYQAR